MSHKSKLSLYQQMVEALESRARYGHSKHEDKAAGIAAEYIYSFDTMTTYKKHCAYFVQWCRDKLPAVLGRAPRTLAECRPFAAEWLQERDAAGMSAYTVKMERSALAKLYGAPIDVQLRGTRRADITRSRGDAVRDAHFSEARHADLVNFCRCAGPRRAELAALDASALVWSDNMPFVHYVDGTKGGKARYSPIVGTEEEVAQAVAYLETLTGDNKVPSAADIHAYRADYATRVYNIAKRPIESLRGQRMNYTAATGKRARDGSVIYKSALYYCRGDRAGDVLDRDAMITVSKCLGHNRESVVADHYIRL